MLNQFVKTDLKEQLQHETDEIVRRLKEYNGYQPQSRQHYRYKSQIYPVQQLSMLLQDHFPKPKSKELQELEDQQELERLIQNCLPMWQTHKLTQEQILEYNKIIAFQHINRDDLRFSEKPDVNLLLQKMEDNVSTVQKYENLIQQMSSIIENAPNALSRGREKEVKEKVDEYYEGIAKEILVIVNQGELIVTYENVLNCKMKEILIKKLELFLSLINQLTEINSNTLANYELGMLDKEYPYYGTPNDKLDDIHKLQSLEVVFKRLQKCLSNVKESDLKCLSSNLAEKIEDGLELLTIQIAILNYKLHEILKYDNNPQIDFDTKQSQIVQKLQQLLFVVQCSPDIQIDNSFAEGQRRINALQRYPGDNGRITNYHFVINSNNINPVFQQMAPEQFYDDSRVIQEQIQQIQEKALQKHQDRSTSHSNRSQLKSGGTETGNLETQKSQDKSSYAIQDIVNIIPDNQQHHKNSIDLKAAMISRRASQLMRSYTFQKQKIQELQKGDYIQNLINKTFDENDRIQNMIDEQIDKQQLLKDFEYVLQDYKRLMNPSLELPNQPNSDLNSSIVSQEKPTYIGTFVNQGLEVLKDLKEVGNKKTNLESQTRKQSPENVGQTLGFQQNNGPSPNHVSNAPSSIDNPLYQEREMVETTNVQNKKFLKNNFIAHNLTKEKRNEQEIQFDIAHQELDILNTTAKKDGYRELMDENFRLQTVKQSEITREKIQNREQAIAKVLATKQTRFIRFRDSKFVVRIDPTKVPDIDKLREKNLFNQQNSAPVNVLEFEMAANKKIEDTYTIDLLSGPPQNIKFQTSNLSTAFREIKASNVIQNQKFLGK